MLSFLSHRLFYFNIYKSLSQFPCKILYWYPLQSFSILSFSYFLLKLTFLSFPILPSLHLNLPSPSLFPPPSSPQLRREERKFKLLNTHLTEQRTSLNKKRPQFCGICTCMREKRWYSYYTIGIERYEKSE